MCKGDGAGAPAAARRTNPGRADPVPLIAVTAALPAQGAAAAALAWTVRRFTGLRASRLSAGAALVGGLVLARAPWPAENYAGGSVFLGVAGCFAVACLAWPDPGPDPGPDPAPRPAVSRRTSRAPGTSTSS